METLVETGRGDTDRRDPEAVVRRNYPRSEACGKIYWSQKGPDNAGLGRIFRANIDIPQGASPANRSDIEVVFDRSCRNRSTSSSILANRVLYWTDRGDPPRGNTVNRAPIDKKAVPEHPHHRI